jgi:hypothetical protein
VGRNASKEVPNALDYPRQVLIIVPNQPISFQEGCFASNAHRMKYPGSANNISLWALASSKLAANP